RRVLPQDWSPHLGVAANAEFRYRTSSLQILDITDRSMRVVARRARQLAFAHRHVSDGAFRLGPPQAVASGADFRLRCLYELVLDRLETVNAMAGRAGQISPLVRATLPPDVVGAVVTRQADLVHFPRLHLLDLWYVTAGVVFHVCLPGSMAALAPMGGSRRSWVLCLSVGGALELFTLFFVALQTFGGSDVAALRGGRLGTGGGRCRFRL